MPIPVRMAGATALAAVAGVVRPRAASDPVEGVEVLLVGLGQGVRPRDLVGKTRRRIAAEEITELAEIENTASATQSAPTERL